MAKDLGRDFSLLWAAQAVSLVGSEISAVAIPLFAIGVLGFDAAELGILLALQGVPPVIFGVFAGVWVDRVSQRRLLLASDVLRAVLVAFIPLLYWADSLSTAALFLCTFLIASVTVFSDIAYWSFIPRIVPDQQLLAGNSRLSMSQSIATTGGPGMAGAIASFIGPTMALVVDAISYLVSFALTKGVSVKKADEPPVTHEPVLEALLSGLRFVFGNRKILLLASGAAIWHLVYFSLLTMLFIYLTRDLTSPAYVVGIVLTCGGLGSLVGAIVISRVKVSIGRLFMLAATLIGAQLPLVLIPVPYSEMWISQVAVAIALLLSGVSAAAHSILHITLRQEETPRDLLGRMTSVVRLISWGAMPLGSLLGGMLLNYYSAVAAFQLNSLIGAGLTVIWLACLIPSLKRREMFERSGEHSE
ncbi:MFS transporter [Pseudomonas sp. 65/3-MNA-CIBAN-0223]|uniref:MFS transporter n=1 Tax=Pseudomonas sp. 65/3-MNA-CIBAN-0223 TaxID=3140476 RepID=UPI003325D6AD